MRYLRTIKSIEMETTENNKLIEEFMGMETDENGMYRYTTSIHDYTTDDLSYFEYSWDWLMPVIQKIYNDFSIDEELVLLIRDAVAEANLDNTYQAVVQFINQLKNQ